MKKGLSKRKVGETKIKKKTSYNAKEKLILALFLVFVIVSIMVLFRASEQPKITGLGVVSTQLEKTQFDPLEDIEGKVGLHIQYIDIDTRDILP